MSNFRIVTSKTVPHLGLELLKSCLYSPCLLLLTVYQFEPFAFAHKQNEVTVFYAAQFISFTNLECNENISNMP